MSTRRRFQNTKQQATRSASTLSSTNVDKESELVNIVDVKDTAMDFYQRHQRNIIAVGTGLLLLIGGYLAYKYLYIGPREKDAVLNMYKAEQQFERDSFAAALKNPGGDAMGFEAIADEYSGTKAGNTAKFYAGICNLNLGKYQEAIEYLEDYDACDDITPALKHASLGDAYSETNEWDKALASYEKAANAADNEFTAPLFLNKLAMLQFYKKQNDKALANFKKITEKYPTSQEAREAEKMIAKLEP